MFTFRISLHGHVQITAALTYYHFLTNQEIYIMLIFCALINFKSNQMYGTTSFYLLLLHFITPPMFCTSRTAGRQHAVLSTCRSVVLTVSTRQDVAATALLCASLTHLQRRSKPFSCRSFVKPHHNKAASDKLSRFTKLFLMFYSGSSSGCR